MKMITPLLPFVLLLSMLFLGCAEEPKPGIIGEGVVMRRSPDAPDVRVGRAGGDLRGYRRFVVDPVRIIPAENVKVKPDAERRIADQFRRELVARLANTYEIVDQAGAGVLRVRAAVINVRPGAGFGLADAHMQAVITDSVTDEPVVAVEDRRRHLSRADGSPLSDWETAKSVMQAWATLARAEIGKLTE